MRGRPEFEPFGGEALDPSQALLHVLEGECIGGLQITTAVLPCVFAQAPGALQAAVERTLHMSAWHGGSRPAPVSCAGQAATTAQAGRLGPPCSHPNLKELP
jgi:pyrrolidone-carboxylate peptidase